jgi:hypothetical protein
MTALPPPAIERRGELIIVRDDRIEGGTKVRALAPLLAARPEAAVVYASPAEGYAQLAIAVAAREAGKTAHLFLAQRPRGQHATSEAARRLGAVWHLEAPGYLSQLQAAARAFADQAPALLLPFGLAMPEILHGLTAVARSLELSPREVWCAAGSGLLTRALQAAWPKAQHHAVRVGRAPDVGRARLWEAPERFAQPARRPPPFPSAPHYDAKVWQFIRAQATPGALFWNVAG